MGICSPRGLASPDITSGANSTGLDVTIKILIIWNGMEWTFNIAPQLHVQQVASCLYWGADNMLQKWNFTLER